MAGIRHAHLRQQAFSATVVTLDGNMQAIKGRGRNQNYQGPKYRFSMLHLSVPSQLELTTLLDETQVTFKVSTIAEAAAQVPTIQAQSATIAPYQIRDEWNGNHQGNERRKAVAPMLQLRVPHCSSAFQIGWCPFAQDPDQGHNGTNGKNGCKINKLPSSFQESSCPMPSGVSGQAYRAANPPREKGGRSHVSLRSLFSGRASLRGAVALVLGTPDGMGKMILE